MKSLGVLFFLVSFPAIGQGLEVPAYLSRDPDYWYNQYLVEQARADGLARYGKTAISGLKASLKAANDTIRSQNDIIKVVTIDRNSATDRAVKAEKSLEACEADRPKTKAGRILKDIGTGIKIGVPALVFGFIIGKLN